MGGKGTHDYQPNVEQLVKKVNAAYAFAKAKKRKSALALSQAQDKVGAAKSISDTAIMELGEAADMLYRAYQETLNRHDAAVTAHRMATAPARDIVVRENGLVVKTFGEDDIVEDVMGLIEIDIVSHSLISDEDVLAAGSEWLTRLTMGITNLIRRDEK